MAFCANCGAQMADGDKFCGNCGAMLPSESPAPQPNFQPSPQQNYQQNVQVNYQNQQAPNFGAGYAQPQMAPQSPSNFAIAMEELGKELSSFIKNPVGTITKVKFQMSSIATYIFAGIMGLVLILLNFWAAAQNFALSGTGKGKSVVSGDVLKFITSFTGDIKKFSSIGYGKIFLASFFFVIIMAAAIWGLTLLVNSAMMKGAIKPVQAINVVAFIAIPYAVLSFVSIILGYVEPNLSNLFYLAGIMASIVLLYKAISTNINKSESSALYCFLIIPIALYFINFLFFKVAGSDISHYYKGIFMGIY